MRRPKNTCSVCGYGSYQLKRRLRNKRFELVCPACLDDEAEFAPPPVVLSLEDLYRLLGEVSAWA